MTPVQATTIPLSLEGKDVVAEAVTGSGKTLAFLLPILQRLMKAPHFSRSPRKVGAIIISPTRELAMQTKQVLDHFLVSAVDPLPLTTKLLIGGQAQGKSLKRKKHTEEEEEEVPVVKGDSANILIATPGRLEQALQQQRCDVKELDMLVLDEADRLLQMGFEASLNHIFANLPKQRRTALFSATMADAQLDVLIRAGLRNPVHVVVKVQAKRTSAAPATAQPTPTTLSISALTLPAADKWVTLLDTLEKEADKKCIVYFATCYCVDYFHRLATSVLHKKYHGLHGKMEMKKRQGVYKAFTEQVAGVLFCTDVAARGLDIPDVDLVIQFDPPQDPQSFVHRSGRTARNGRSGKALLFLQPNEEAYIEFLRLRQIPIEHLSHKESKKGAAMKKSMPEKICRAILNDRDLHDRGVRAFVSYLQMYRKHQASYIFRVEQLDMQSLVFAFYLLRPPKCPELQHTTVEGCASRYLDIKETSALEAMLTYKDSAKQAAFEKKQEERRKEAEAHKKSKQAKLKNGTAWSDRTLTKQKREERRDKKDAKRKALQPNGADTLYDEEEEWKELQKEMRKMKKAKRGEDVSSDEEDEAPEASAFTFT